MRDPALQTPVPVGILRPFLPRQRLFHPAGGDRIMGAKPWSAGIAGPMILSAMILPSSPLTGTNQAEAVKKANHGLTVTTIVVLHQ
jgi:hypothetical protein